MAWQFGADRVVHEETLNYGGRTIAIMGTGFNNIYPPQNLDIYQRILLEGGLVLTEQQDDVKYYSQNFPKRNRIISAISKAVLVVEAAIKSGSTTTARHAWEQGKKVYAIPGRLDNKNGLGINRLIQKGAKLVLNVNDIIEDFEEFKGKNKKIVIHNSRIKKEYRRIYNLLDEEPKSLEEISIKTDNSIQCTLKLLSLMEMEDLIEETSGVRICQKRKRLLNII